MTRASAPTISKRLIDLTREAHTAYEAVGADDAASADLKRMGAELYDRARQARDRTKGADDETAMRELDELMAFAAQAREAARDDDGIESSTRRALADVHEALLELVSDLEP